MMYFYEADPSPIVTDYLQHPTDAHTKDLWINTLSQPINISDRFDYIFAFWLSYAKIAYSPYFVIVCQSLTAFPWQNTT